MINNNSRKYIIVLLCLLGIFFSSTCFLLTDKYLQSSQFKPATNQLQTNQNTEKEVLGIIKTSYLRDFPDQKKLDEYRVKGIVESLKDPYSEYITAEEQKLFDSTLNQKYQGIGIKIEKIESSFVVMDVIENSPAKEKNVQKGDIIVKVEENLVTGQTSNMELISKIRGLENTSVKMQFARNGQAIDVTIPRREIKGEIIKLDIKDGLGIITINSFGEGLDAKMLEISSKIKSDPSIKKIVIDVRSDTGGLLNEVIEVLSYFVPAGTVLVKEKSKSITNIQVLTSKPKPINLIDYKVVVLTDRFSASASEILAGALRDIKGSKIYGEKTFGKGVVQRVFPLNNNDFLKLTVSEWLTPKDQMIDKNGLEPDVKVSPKEDIFEIVRKDLT